MSFLKLRLQITAQSIKHRTPIEQVYFGVWQVNITISQFPCPSVRLKLCPNPFRWEYLYKRPVPSFPIYIGNCVSVVLFFCRSITLATLSASLGLLNFLHILHKQYLSQSNALMLHLEVTTALLIQFDTFKQRLKVPSSKSLVIVTLNYLDEDSRLILERFREYLE